MPAYRRRRAADDLAALEGIGLRTLQRWHAAHKRDGISGLATANRGTTQRWSTPELVALVEGLALLKPRLSLATIARKANCVAADHDWPPLSYSTVRSIATGLDPGMRTLAQQGAVAYRDTYELAWLHRAKRPNAIWQADHTELDILVLDANLKPGRPWLTTILDDYSRAVCGYMLFLGAPSAMKTALALRQAIWPKPEQSGHVRVPRHPPRRPRVGFHQQPPGPDGEGPSLRKSPTQQVPDPKGGARSNGFGSVNTELLTELPGHPTLEF